MGQLYCHIEFPAGIRVEHLADGDRAALLRLQYKKDAVPLETEMTERAAPRTSGYHTESNF